MCGLKDRYNPSGVINTRIDSEATCEAASGCWDEFSRTTGVSLPIESPKVTATSFVACGPRNTAGGNGWGYVPVFYAACQPVFASQLLRDDQMYP